MLVDTHCHLNMMVKKTFDIPLTLPMFEQTKDIILQAHLAGVTTILNVGTSLPESINSVELAQRFPRVFTSVGIHPNDCTENWRDDINELKHLYFNPDQYKTHKIVAIGEVGLDRHYQDHNLVRQKDALRIQLDLALEHDLAIIIHTREAVEETVNALDEYKSHQFRGVIHCFSEGQEFADYALSRGFVLGIGGPLTYPKNNYLREVFKKVPLNKIVLETDAPFLPPQIIRGKKNSPQYIATIAHYLAELRDTSFDDVAIQTTNTALKTFNIPVV